MAVLIADKNRHLDAPRGFLVADSYTCLRCGGLMVAEVWSELSGSKHELEYPGRRCVLYGDIVDAVILRNRLLSHH